MYVHSYTCIHIFPLWLIHVAPTGNGSRINRAQASRAEGQQFESWASQNNHIQKICVLLSDSALLGYDKDWLAQYQDNGRLVTMLTDSAFNSAAPLENQATDTMIPWPHSVTVSWHWGNQSLPYPINAKCQARKRQVSSLCHWLDYWEPISRSMWGPCSTDYKKNWKTIAD